VLPQGLMPYQGCRLRWVFTYTVSRGWTIDGARVSRIPPNTAIALPDRAPRPSGGVASDERPAGSSVQLQYPRGLTPSRGCSGAMTG
jgi:hypothetical protein